ncbi:hypothetical protein [Hymenobacter volaticus]|uniref:Uncharacterized protein n=1 Tax=Hymenobacter volaticus TaxID=2932254 RepID=A0ABY4G1X8_9BACT|nr:hypothetical protein [Hymenobacter volaticus]UOQ64875.1 hypothetical protein MUN86_15030 [Hymenobacter volaticus]
MDNSLKKINNRIKEIIIAVNKVSHVCYNPLCETHNMAINSHVLQNKVLWNHIIGKIHGKDKIIQLSTSDYFQQLKFTEGRIYQFSPAGPELNMMAYWGFCNPPCDNDLFSSFEDNPNTDYSAPKTQLLLSYRAYLRLMQVDEYTILIIDEILRDPLFADTPEAQKTHWRMIRAEKIGNCLKHYILKRTLEWFISNPANNTALKFITFELPRVPVATSTFYTEEHYAILDPGIVNNFTPDYRQKSDNMISYSEIPIVFLHLIPNDNSLTVLIGYSNLINNISGIPVDEITKLAIPEKFKLISDVLIKRVETWCMSPAFYENLKSTGQEEKILKAIDHHLDYENKHLPVEVNIFEGVV